MNEGGDKGLRRSLDVLDEYGIEDGDVGGTVISLGDVGGAERIVDGAVKYLGEFCLECSSESC